MKSLESFDADFQDLTGYLPLRWQRRLFLDHFIASKIPSSIDIPTGLGKTSVIAIWYLALKAGAAIPRRLVYVVDRRTVVDQATTMAELLKARSGDRALRISTLRGRYVDNREWQDDPSAPGIIVGTVDMIGSRLLFSGYGVSPKKRSYHAGLLGVDVLIVLDEAHLVPPFAHLLRAIEQGPAFQASNEVARALLPRFLFLPLSATQRDVEGYGTAFSLEEADWKTDCITKMRLDAKKRLRVSPLEKKAQDEQLASAALALANKDGKSSRVVVYCDRRYETEGSGGPSAEGVAKAIERLAQGDKKSGRSKLDIYPVELLVGARRVHEREKVVTSLHNLGFIGEKKALDKPAFLVATSAGEVGADIDADHMVCDLVTWERMVQRLGRVNRRGEGDAEVAVFWSEPAVKDASKPTDVEKRALAAFGCKAVIEKLPQIDESCDASPGALCQFAERARNDFVLKQMVNAATTPEPLRPALSRAIIDAWSMTSLEVHTGRPDIAPWLRGWVDDALQTTVVWRTHLPIRVDGGGRITVPIKREIESFFEAAPPHESEKLDTEPYHVATWLQVRGAKLLKSKQHPSEAGIDDGEENTASVVLADDDFAAEGPIDQTKPQAREVRRQDVVALMLSPSGTYAGSYTLGDLAQERKGNAKEAFQTELIGKIVVVDAKFGGLMNGLLELKSDGPLETADTNEEWSKSAQFRVRLTSSPGINLSPDDSAGEWRVEDEFDLRRNEEGAPLEQLIIEHFKEFAQNENGRSIAKPQELAVHQDWTRREMARIATAIGLPNAAINALTIAAGLHDEGKKASRWQRAFRAERDAAKYDLICPLAKTRGPIIQKTLGGYRHEFGSLPEIEKSAEFAALSGGWQDLVLHIVAAHHGQGRPIIETSGCDDGPPSLLETRACAIALRFARLQKLWGPWGLAWWETLLRAADQRASRDNEEGRAPVSMRRAP